MPTQIATFAPIKLEPYIDPQAARTFAYQMLPNLTVVRGTIIGQQAAVNDVQTITLNNSPTGGTWIPTTGAAAVAYNASAAAVQTSLAAIYGAGNVSVTGSAGGPYTVTFKGLLAGTPQAVLVPDGSLLTGSGSQPTATVVHTTTGVPNGKAGPYASGNTDGTQFPVGPAVYDFTTDASGNVTLGLSGTVTDLIHAQQQTAEVYWKGTFLETDLVGLDSNAVTAMLAREVGTGVYRMLHIP